MERRAPQQAYQREKRSFYLRGRNPFRGSDTTIAMERFYWVALEGIARERHVRWRWLVKTVLSRKPRDYKSRSGWLRYYVTGYYIFRPKKGASLVDVFMPEQGWSLRQLKDHLAANSPRRCPAQHRA
jgi:predicted DNA-binding ribbon-helix-helix protein